MNIRIGLPTNLKHRSFWLAFAIACLLISVIMMTTTTPQNIGPGGVMAWFMICYIGLIACLTALGAYIFQRQHLVEANVITQNAIISFVIVSVIALRSLGQLQVRDILLLIALVVVLTTFTRNRTNK